MFFSGLDMFVSCGKDSTSKLHLACEMSHVKQAIIDNKGKLDNALTESDVKFCEEGMYKYKSLNICFMDIVLLWNLDSTLIIEWIFFYSKMFWFMQLIVLFDQIPGMGIWNYCFIQFIQSVHYKNWAFWYLKLTVVCTLSLSTEM
jgi:hypothetical protein